MNFVFRKLGMNPIYNAYSNASPFKYIWCPKIRDILFNWLFRGIKSTKKFRQWMLHKALKVLSSGKNWWVWLKTLRPILGLRKCPNLNFTARCLLYWNDNFFTASQSCQCLVFCVLYIIVEVLTVYSIKIDGDTTRHNWLTVISLIIMIRTE